MTKYSIDAVVDGLCKISDKEFSCENVYDFLGNNPVDVDSIKKYFFWSNENYTRNLIYKDERFEVMTVCWEKGQISRVHNHADQKCWMTVPIGTLQGQNFAVAEMDPARGFCRLIETNRFELSECLAAKVDLEEPVHQIMNLEEFGGRAVSIHIYSKPFNRCLSYDRGANTYKEVPLFYTSIDGKLCSSV